MRSFFRKISFASRNLENESFVLNIILKENIVNPIVKQFKYGQHTVTLETGAIARQANCCGYGKHGRYHGIRYCCG